MQETLCDIIPHANGWVFMLDGVQSEAYPTYAMALRAATERTAMRSLRSRTDGRIIMRLQTLKGEMRTLSVVEPAKGPAPALRRHG